jgi:BirA family biotin operon repressor/biotin-[acetyl-CoA-carboxylase] ligase
MGTREALLDILRDRAGDYVSGEDLSRTLCISRAAVSKHVAVLKQTGYAISASPGKGYLFGGTPDLLLPGEIRHHLNTRIFGRGMIDYHPVIGSTNDQAKHLAAGGAGEGTLVLAEQQTEGRGRKGRSWLSPTGEGLCLSMILRPRMSPAEASRLTLMTAVALAEALIQLTNLPIRIKWPNDLLVHGKKLAGILTEMTMEMDQVDVVVVGLGLNINSPRDHFAPDIRELATSLLIESGRPWKRPALIAAFLSHFEAAYDLIQNQGFPDLLKRWKALSDLIGRPVSVHLLDTEIHGRVVDVDDEGFLILEDHDGRCHRVVSGDVVPDGRHGPRTGTD